jgi:hypothetical protein
MLIKKKLINSLAKFNRGLYDPIVMSSMCSGLNCKKFQSPETRPCVICTNLNRKCAIWKSGLIRQYVFIPIEIYEI